MIMSMYVHKYYTISVHTFVWWYNFNSDITFIHTSQFGHIIIYQFHNNNSVVFSTCTFNSTESFMIVF